LAKDAYYFKHDSNAKDDKKCSMLIEQLGCEGYGIYWILIETLREQPDFRYPLQLVPIIARKYNTTAEKIKVVIGNYNLFVVDSDEFFSESLCRRMESWEKTKELNSIKGKKSGQSRALRASRNGVVELFLNSGSTAVELGEENIGEEKRGDENKYNNISPALQKALKDFIQHRKQRKKPLTDLALELIIADLDRYAATDDEKIAILHQSIKNSWVGVFPLKGDDNERRSDRSGNGGSKPGKTGVSDKFFA